MSATRTDRHRPSAPEFDPEDYECWGVFDLSPEWGDNGERMRTVNRALEDGYRFASHQHGGQCGHCGARLRYVALMAHKQHQLRLDFDVHHWPTIPTIYCTSSYSLPGGAGCLEKGQAAGGRRPTRPPVDGTAPTAPRSTEGDRTGWLTVTCSR